MRILIATALALATACNSSGFNGSDSAKSVKKDPLKQPADSADGVNGGNSNGDFPNGANGAQPCVPEEIPVKVLIVVDNSSSMTPALDSIRSGITQIFSALKTVQPQGSEKPLSNVEVGVKTFADRPENWKTYELTNDINAMKQQLQSLSIDMNPTNNDGPEEGLAAMKEATRYLDQKSGGKDFLPIVYLISDNYAHNGGGSNGNRNYDHTQLTQDLKRPSLKRLFIFDSTPQEHVVDQRDQFTKEFPPQGSPAAQWQAVRNLKNASGSAIPGQAFGFPFQSDQMINQLPKSLSSALKACD